MKSNSYPHTHMMTLKEWKQFVRNCKNFHPERPMKDYLMECKDDFFKLIYKAFDWHKTPDNQGIRYWYDISQRTKPVE